MPSAINTRHSKQNSETNAKSFLFNAKIIPQNAVHDGTNAVSASECLTNPTTKIAIGIADFFKSIFDGRFKYSIMEATKETWKIKRQDFTHEKEYRERFPERARRKVNAEDWNKHFHGGHVVIVKSGRNLARFLALDIDQKDISETDLIFELIQIEQDTGLKLYYAPSTSLRSWHIWGFSKKATPVKELKKLAYFITYKLPFEVCTIYPNGGHGISAPMAKNRPLRNTQGIDQTPDSIEFNNVSSILNNLPSVDIPTNTTNVLEGNTANEKTAPKTKKDYIPESMPHMPIPVEVGEVLAQIRDKEIFINKLFELYPLYAKYRHWMCLLVSADFIKRFGCTLDETLEIIKQIATAKNDEEIEDRLQTVRSTFKRFKKGQRIASTKMYLKSKIFKTCFFTKTTSSKVLRSELKNIRLMRSVTALYENGFFDGGQDDWQRITDRLLAVIAGISRVSAKESLKEMVEIGIIKEVKTGKKNHSNYFVIGLNKNMALIAPYLIDIEVDPSPLDIVRTTKKSAGYDKDRSDYEHKKKSFKQDYAATQVPAPVGVVDTVVIDLKAPSDHSQTNVKTPSEVAAPALIVADGDYAPKPLDVAEDYAEGSAPLANAPP